MSAVILLVEDENYIRRKISERLQSEGYSVLSADGPLEAIDYCRTEGRDIGLIILDIMMPDEDAFNEQRKDLSNGMRTGLLLKAKLDGIFSGQGLHPPYLIVLTGYDNKEDIKHIEEMANAIIRKPASEEDVVKVVKNWLPLRQSK